MKARSRSGARLLALACAVLLAPLLPGAAEDPPARPESAATGATSATVQSKDGTRIAYTRSGEGPTVILVGGALSDRSGSAGMARLLSERFTAVAYDRRGRGQSGDTPPYAVEREVEDLAALIEAHGGEAHLFGASSGAVLALEAAARIPEHVKRVVLYEPPFVVDASRAPVPAGMIDAIEELLAEERRGDAVALFMTEAVGVPAEAVAQMREMPMWKGLERLAHTLPNDFRVVGDTQGGRPLPRERWKAARAEVLVLHGGASPPWLAAGARELAKVLPNAELDLLEGLDHAAPMMAPKAVAPRVIEHLAR